VFYSLENVSHSLFHFLQTLLTLSVLGIAHAQQDGGVFTAYSPGAYAGAAPISGVYKATPRLVAVKVSSQTNKQNRNRRFSSSRTAPLQNISPFSENAFYGQQAQPQQQHKTILTPQQTAYVPRHIRIRPQTAFQSAYQYEVLTK
jgi:hypothetical protein